MSVQANVSKPSRQQAVEEILAALRSNLEEHAFEVEFADGITPVESDSEFGQPVDYLIGERRNGEWTAARTITIKINGGAGAYSTRRTLVAPKEEPDR